MRIGSSRVVPGTNVAGTSDDPAAAERWYTLSEDRLGGRARAWLAAQGYTPTRALRP